MSSSPLSVVRGSAMYVGALLGPGLLMLPGLTAALAGPASVVTWAALLVLSGLLGWVFAALGIRLPSADGVRGYVALGLGRRASAATSWCFLAGIVAGAPIVCVIGGAYVAELAGAGRVTACLLAAAILVAVLAITSRGLRTSSTVQFGLVVLLLVVVAVSVIGGATAAEAANWTPFAPHGWAAIGTAAAPLMLSFVGWEAAAPLTARLADPRRQLPRIVATTLVVTSLLYLSLAAVTVAALGPEAGSSTPVAKLLVLAVGPAGVVLASVCAVVLTMGTINAYVSGAANLARTLTKPHDDADTPPRWLNLAILASGVVLIGLLAGGVLELESLVTVPSALFLVVYLGCTAAAWRLLDGGVRVAAAAAFVVVLVVLAFTGAAAVPAVVVALAAMTARGGRAGGGSSPAAASPRRSVQRAEQ
ncbi:APC family permease [Lentzea jiangxiensis]|uniref:Amino acid efflux transporter n=1 Tax=Lentzea jiangxiensis TaxID=641025 RepID=A0A1H0JJD5_9PSEU|nr:APC family permease [Lentzea jiangxiensis]SDO43692.1 amino acid efflux transporter [Lentzea jiangxiensis]